MPLAASPISLWLSVIPSSHIYIVPRSHCMNGGNLTLAICLRENSSIFYSRLPGPLKNEDVSGDSRLFNYYATFLRLRSAPIEIVRRATNALFASGTGPTVLRAPQ